jgi:L-seryl-tRNA(Ser) seleniumtransferase
MTDPRSAIPSIDRFLAVAQVQAWVEAHGRVPVLAAIRAALSDMREALSRGVVPAGCDEPDFYLADVGRRLEAGEVSSLRPVVNATGVVLHTNLGRAPLARAAVEAMVRAAGEYTNLEYDLGAGRRGSRYVHCAELLTELTGAEDALVVNNAAAALLLALNTLALGRGVVVSRGELVEIGGGFRIPEILERSGARLVEVGSTNRTRLADYRRAIGGGGLSAVLKVHRSNFRITGFTEEPSLAAVGEEAHEAGLPLVYDLGSGLMVDPSALTLPPEPRAAEAIEAGADLVVFSGDKLLGGPQAGIIVGREEFVARLRSNPMCRALRVDKTTLAALEATLRLYRRPDDAMREIPTLAMLRATADDLRARAESLSRALESAGVESATVPVKGAIGGGTYPGVELDSWAVAPEVSGSVQEVADRLRLGDPPVVARIADGRLLLDVRTVLPGQEARLVACVVSAVAGRAEG